MTKSPFPTLSHSHLFLQHTHNQCIQLFHSLFPQTLSAHTRQHLCKYDTAGKKKKTKMQRKKNDRGLCFPALQVKNHVHQILLSTQFRRGQKSQIPLRGLDDLSGLFSPDILRFLQTQPQGSGADIKTVRRDFPGGPVIETQRSQCRGCTFDPCLGN